MCVYVCVSARAVVKADVLVIFILPPVPCCWAPLSPEIIDSNFFPLECPHLLALGDGEVLYLLQLSSS